MSKNNLILLIAAFLISNLSLSQKIDSTTYNGEKVYIYPFKVQVNQHGTYRDAADLKSLIQYTYKTYSREIKEDLGAEMDIKGFDRFVRKLERERRNEKSYKKAKLKKAIRKNPKPLLNPQYSFSQDIVPSLDPIPNGKYIQYFEPFCLIDRQGNCRDDLDMIAGVFNISNGILNGEAVWFDINGDTLKYGSFNDGLKEGKWFLERRKPVSYSFGYSDVLKYIEFGYPTMDTIIEVAEFKNGAKNGKYLMYDNSMHPILEGHFTDGNESGDWLHRDPDSKIATGENKWNNSRVTRRYTLKPEMESDTVKLVWVRKELISKYGLGYPHFNFFSKYGLVEPPSDLYTPNFEVEPDLELDEEKIMAYDEYGSRESNSYYYEYDYRYGDYMPFQKSYFDVTLDQYRKRGEIMDSIGFVPKYADVYEVRYPNGQLAFRWDFQSSNTFVDDTLFWDNGIPHDVVVFNADSNQFVRSAYDYEGKLYKSLIYDSLGDFLRVDFEFDARTKEIIDGYTVYKPEYGGNYEYYMVDTLSYELEDELALYRSWSIQDKAPIHIDLYDPKERVLNERTLSMLSNPRRVAEKKFSEDYKSWTGKDTIFAGDLQLRAIRSASIYEGWDIDTVLQMNVGFSEDRYSITSDYQLFKDGEAYSGPVNIDFNKSRFKISKGDLKIALPSYKNRTPKKRYKQIQRYIAKGKVADPLLFSCINSSNSDLDFGPFFFSAFFGDPIGNAFDLYTNYMGEFSMEYEMPTTSGLASVTGYMHDGKPIGEWKAFDKSGKLLTIANYDKGELNGKLKRYDYAYPATDDFSMWYEDPFGDSLPPKITHYLSVEMEYKNGMLDGLYTNYNWLGEIVQQAEYKEDYRNGPSIERNNLAFTKMNFLDGMLDGYLQTYLTAEEGDTIILYDLNFQNGLLQGESKAYHINGLLAKRGFFLNGQPIEDYEGFDSLGFRYHYVKFQYSFPIEEKIWEENELSVKYNFDWRDSIYFEPNDITSSQSLESTLFDLGFGQDYLEQPYYGRPSLVDKSGIHYEMTKYYPNDQIARHGFIENGKKIGCWTYYNYDGEFLYEVDYFDSIIELNDSIRFKVKGIYSEFDHKTMTPEYNAYVIEKFEKYDCSHSDHYEIRQLWTIDHFADSVDRMNGYVVNYYDNGTIQSEGSMKDGLPTGFWKIYDPFGKLNQYGQYVLGKRNGRWLSGDLSKTKYLGDICLNPNLPDFEDEVSYRENLLNVVITSYKLGSATSRQYYDINMNRFIEEEEDSLLPPAEIIED
jgi:uncharacterized protein